MSSGEERAKWRWWRPRFSLRTLAIVVTLACAYFAAWEATKRYGVPSSIEGDRDLVPEKYSLGYDNRSPMPFVVRRIEWRPFRRVNKSSISIDLKPTSTYHIWFFGPAIRLPIESCLIP
jgi:hypothetical protein